MKSIHNPRELAENACEMFRDCYRDDLVSVILFGSAVGVNFDPEKSDIDLLIVLKTMTLAEIEKSEKIQARLIKSRFSRPLFMDADYINRSLDSFPMEFLNMKESHSVLSGPDILEDITIGKEDLRLQVERELKGKWLHLMGLWLSLKNNPKALYEFYHVSLNDFSALFRALLFLKDCPVPDDRQKIFADVCEAYGVPDNPFAEIFRAYESKDTKTLKSKYLDYSRAIRHLTISME